MEYLDKYDKLVKILTEEIEIDGKTYDLKVDFEKFFIRDNRTAGTRVRRVMQELKKLAQEVRDDIQKEKKEL